LFFDDYPLFNETSKTAPSKTRLNVRHQAIIEANRDILKGARVLDLASHDGRWSFAALKAGAAHVTGVEARPQLVDNANKTFAEYGVPTDQYEFIAGDMFRVMKRRKFDVDVVICLGFIYHTLRYGELFRGIIKASPQHVILDTKIMEGDEPLVRLNVNLTGPQSNAARDRVSHGHKALAGWPTLSALKLMLDVYDLDVEDEYDWPALLATLPKVGALNDYHVGNRVTLRCSARQTGTSSTAPTA